MTGVTGTTSGHRPRVLIVENDAGVRRSMQLLLQARGFDVRAYSGGQTLLADVTLRKPDCLVADYLLDDETGIAVLKAMRALDWDGPAILVSAYASAELEHDAREAGFAAVFEKPLREYALVDAVARLTRRPGIG